MNSVTSILIPSGFPEGSRKALKYALSFYRQEACIFYMLYADSRLPQPSTVHDIGHEPPRRLPDNFQDYILEESATAANQGHRFIFIKENGNFLGNIRSLVASKNIDLIIMPDCVGREMQQTAANSRSWEVITRTTCNVLLLPCKGEFRPIREVAFATDYNFFYTNTLLEYLSLILHRTSANLCVLEHSGTANALLPSQEANKNFLFSYLNETFASTTGAIARCQANIPEAVQNIVCRSNVGLLVLEARNINLLQQLLFRANAQKPGRSSLLPLWILHD